MDRVEQIIKEASEQVKNYSSFRIKGINSICSTCKFFNGKYCKKGFSHVGFATKLADCNDEWEVCNG